VTADAPCAAQATSVPARAEPSGDHITLTGLRATAFHGVFPEERRDGQVFVIDVTVWLDLTVSAAGDELSKTIHYGELADDVVAAVERDPVALLETVAQRIADVVLLRAEATAARVTLHKPSAPNAVPFGDVSVTITRARS
jgi:dihydroneopterin aldolase